jgi:hypothetical protein
MAVPGAPYLVNVMALLPHYRLAPGFAAQDQQNPTATEIGQYHADINDWRLELTAQLLVIAPGFQTNAQWPAGLPATANQAARLAKVAEIDNYIGVFMPEYSNRYQQYGQAMLALIPPAPVITTTAPAATAAAALAPGGGQIGPPLGALPPPWHHLYMAAVHWTPASWGPQTPAASRDSWGNATIPTPATAHGSQKPQARMTRVLRREVCCCS